MKKLMIILMSLFISISIFAGDLNDYQHFEFRWGQSIEEYIEEYGELRFPVEEYENNNKGFLAFYPVESYNWKIKYHFIFDNDIGLYTINFNMGNHQLDNWISSFNKKYNSLPKNDSSGNMMWESRKEIAKIIKSNMDPHNFVIAIYSKENLPERLENLVKGVD